MLNRIVNLYLDFAELQAKSHVPMYMKDWIKKLDDFLSLSGKELSPVEIHFLEAFEAERKRLEDKI